MYFADRAKRALIQQLLLCLLLGTEQRLTVNYTQHDRNTLDCDLRWVTRQRYKNMCMPIWKGAPVGCFAHVCEAVTLLHLSEAPAPSPLLGFHIRHGKHLVLLGWRRLLPLLNLLLHLCLYTKETPLLPQGSLPATCCTQKLLYSDSMNTGLRLRGCCSHI